MALAKLGLAGSGLIAGTYEFFRVFFERKRAAGGERKFGRISVSAWYSTEEFLRLYRVVRWPSGARMGLAEGSKGDWTGPAVSWGFGLGEDAAS